MDVSEFGCANCVTRMWMEMLCIAHKLCCPGLLSLTLHQTCSAEHFACWRAMIKRPRSNQAEQRSHGVLLLTAQFIEEYGGPIVYFFNALLPFLHVSSLLFLFNSSSQNHAILVISNLICVLFLRWYQLWLSFWRSSTLKSMSLCKVCHKPANILKARRPPWQSPSPKS